MAFIRRAFKTTGFMNRPIGYSLGRHVYVTADDVATIEAAGYFNDIAKLVQAGDHLDVTAALGVTPVRRDYVIGSVAGGVVSITPGQGGGVPANALTLRDNSPLTLRDGSNLTLRSAA